MNYQELVELFDKFKESALNKRRFKHADLLRLIQRKGLEKEIIGQSFEGKDIYKIKIGSGKRQILLWSQMHGNEATATMTLLDIFCLFEQLDSSFLRLLKEELTMHFVPMLNPDGADRFTRRTAQLIDMNRDAVSLAAPESRILKRLQMEIKPEFSFNLHDQNVRYAAGKTSNQAGISFLATAFNEATEWNANRTKAMQVICGMNSILQHIIPNKVGRFTDEYEPRAFGDNIQKWGSSLILIESGGFAKDTEKAFLRKLNFVIILKALESIAKNNYNQFILKDYTAIPTNEKCLFDLLIRNVHHQGALLDIGINLEEKNNLDASDFINQSTIEDIGDLSTFWGIEEFDANGMNFTALNQFSEILTKYKLNKDETEQLELEKKANFALSKDGKPRYYIINGKLLPENKI